MRTVELLPDDELDRAIRAAWGRLDAAGFSSLAQHRHPTNRPHLTLASAELLSPAAAAGIAEALRVLPIAVRLDGLHFFGGRAGVLAWAVDGGDVLRELQAGIWLALDGADRNPQLDPGEWAPHITLARRVQPDQLEVAAQAVGVDVAAGRLSAARSYDSLTRTVTPLQ
ncbi:MAG: 2'-5' RNA ligase family protein [Actinobacteria bacterium]|nr:2'-5' RNA ligase family protein [Actinomycetota bacterium]